jgi:predicted protein tyrosine phosphatase
MPPPGPTKSCAAADTLFVCGYPNLWDHISAVQPHHLISILGPHDTHAPWPVVTGIPHLRLEIDDVHRPCNGFCHATPAHVRQLVTFLHDWHPERGERLLIHCWAGSSRSTAAALVAMAVKQPGREVQAARMLRRAAPQARPNGLMVQVADEVMGLEGRLVAAVAGMEGPRGVAVTDLIRLNVL